MTNLILLAAIGVGAMYYLNSQTKKDLQQQIEDKNAEIYEEIQQQIQDGTVTPDSVIDGVEIEKAMIGFSSISDKYWNCAAGVIWKNTTNEPIDVKIDSATFSVGGYEMIVGVKDARTITVPAQGTIYQELFSYNDKTLFATKDERKQVRIVIGDAQGHPGKEGRDVWGKVDFDAVIKYTYSAVGAISHVQGKQGVVPYQDAIGRYYGSTALAWQLKKWVRTYIGG